MGEVMNRFWYWWDSHIIEGKQGFLKSILPGTSLAVLLGCILAVIAHPVLGFYVMCLVAVVNHLVVSAINIGISSKYGDVGFRKYCKKRNEAP